jgi:hypothetical protein
MAWTVEHGSSLVQTAHRLPAEAVASFAGLELDDVSTGEAFHRLHEPSPTQEIATQTSSPELSMTAFSEFTRWVGVGGRTIGVEGSRS